MCLWAIEDTKREAVRLVLEEGMGVREVERNLGITFGVVKGWVQKQRDHQDAAFVGRVAANSPEAEPQGERTAPNILKKAVTIRIVMQIHNLRVVSRSRYYAQLNQTETRGSDQMLLVAIQAAFDGSGQTTYGAGRVLSMNFKDMESEQAKIASGG